MILSKYMVKIQQRYWQFRDFCSAIDNLTILLVSIFFVLGLVGIINHEMWRDELQAWLIAKDSNSLANLYQNLRYEGHPALWHLCLYIITRFTNNPAAMQFFHLMIATAVIYVFVKFSPFSIAQKILFTFSYFPFYEYNLISRNYSLGILLAFIFCHVFVQPNKSYLMLSVIIGLIANTNVYSLIIAMCLTAALIIDYFTNSKPSINKLLFGICVAICLVGILVSVQQIIPPPDSIFQGNNKSSNNEGFLTQIINLRLRESIYMFWKAYIPIPDFTQNYNFWNTNIIDTHGIMRIIAALSVLLLLLALTCCLMNKAIALFIYVSGNIAIFLFSYLKFLGSVRHHGHLFILLLVSIWIFHSHDLYLCFNQTKLAIFNKIQKISTQKLLNRCLTIILCTQVFSGIYAYSIDFAYPFSTSKQVAQYIEKQRLDEHLIFGSEDFIISPIAAWLDRKIYFSETSKFGSFINWNKREKKTPQTKINQINKLIKNNNKGLFLILSYPFETEFNLNNQNLKISKQAVFDKGIVGDEKYYLYLVKNKI